jgi:hypothetical protein
MKMMQNLKQIMTKNLKTSEWQYEDKTLEEPLEGMIGFVYEIKNLLTSRCYIGQKQFYSKVTRPPLKGNIKKRRTVRQSDWRDYWGSSEELKRDVLSFGEDNFARKVLFGCQSKSELNYREAKMHPESFYNGIINIRCNAKALLGHGGLVLLKKVKAGLLNPPKAKPTKKSLSKPAK